MGLGEMGDEKIKAQTEGIACLISKELQWVDRWPLKC